MGEEDRCPECGTILCMVGNDQCTCLKEGCGYRFCFIGTHNLLLAKITIILETTISAMKEIERCGSCKIDCGKASECSIKKALLSSQKKVDKLLKEDFPEGEII